MSLDAAHDSVTADVPTPLAANAAGAEGGVVSGAVRTMLVGADITVTAPEAFDAVTVDRIVCPTSRPASSSDDWVAPETITQLDPEVLQSSQRY
ncbi:MAG TPA: hypothetical protein VIL77_08695 [Gaiellaceae bacterium]